MKLILIGFMGSGKTTISQLLGQQLGLPVTDLDQAIIADQQQTIPEIFAAVGEQGFRQVESRVLKTTLTQQDGILATGGGTPLREDNRRELAMDPAPVVFLHASPAETARRLAGATDRPIANQLDVAGLGRLLAQRQSRYAECADFTVETDGRAPAEIAAEIKRLIVP